jgi:hypothetical protein
VQHWRFRVQQQLQKVQSQRLEARQRIVSLMRQRQRQQQEQQGDGERGEGGVAAPLEPPARQQLEVEGAAGSPAGNT